MFVTAQTLLRRWGILESVKLCTTAIVQNISARTGKAPFAHIDGFLDQSRGETNEEQIREAFGIPDVVHGIVDGGVGSRMRGRRRRRAGSDLGRSGTRLGFSRRNAGNCLDTD